MNKIINSLLFIAFLGMFASCDKSQNNPNTPGLDDPTSQVIMKQVAYSSVHSRNVLDVYLPANRTAATPFILLIHGGGWSSGDKADFNALQDSLMKRGIASASMNYQFASITHHYEGLMKDVKLALNFIKTKSSNWVIRNNNYAIGGMSAGAHMSLLYAYQYDTAHAISAVINACGPTDITYRDWLNYGVLIGQIGLVNNMVGAEYNALTDLHPRFYTASPLNQVRNVPTLSIHGTADAVVSYEHANRIKSKFASLGYDHKLVTIEGAGHDLGVGNPATLQLILNEMEWWIKNKS